jgi:hypothetical protein
LAERNRHTRDKGCCCSDDADGKVVLLRHPSNKAAKAIATLAVNIRTARCR